MGDKFNLTYEASDADVAAMRMQMTFTRNTKEGRNTNVKISDSGRIAQITSRRIH